jgi:poly(3-hydroxybutyrate) depolymerase
MKTMSYSTHRLALFACANLLLTACSLMDAQPPNDAHRASVVPANAPRNAQCQLVRATGTSGVIDDFETGPGRIVSNEGRGGYWFSYDDGTGGKLLREEISDDTRVLHVKASGFTQWGAGIGASILSTTSRTRACGYDASAYSGIRFRARGKGRMRLLFSSVANTPASQGGLCRRSENECYDRPGVWVDLKEQWQIVEQPFCAFFPEGWGGNRSGLDASDLVAVQFQLDARQDFELWLDDLAFFTLEKGAIEVKCGRKCPLDEVPPGAIVNPSFSTARLTEELSLHTLQQSTKSCGALTRRYLSFVPKRLEHQTSAPVLMVLHGSEANAESMQRFMTRGRFDELAARDGFIVIYGNAAPGVHMDANPGMPNTGVWRQAFFDDGAIDDVEYLLAVIVDLKSRGVTSGNNAVYLTGISNGGGMVLEAAKRAPDRFRGIAPLMAFDGWQPTPVPELRGKGLKRVLFVYTVNDPGLLPGYHDILRTLPMQWARAMGIPQSVIENPKRADLPDRVREGDGYNGRSKAARATLSSRATQHDMVDAGTDARLRVVAFDHAGHFWPNPMGESESWVIDRWGFRNQDFDAADMLWDFFSDSATK